MPVRYDKLVPALKRLLEEDRIDVIGRSVVFIRKLRQLSASAFVWASLLALALSRCVSTWLAPLASLVGLSARVRAAVLTRALRGNMRLLARALTARASDAVIYLRQLAEELLTEARQLQPTRADSLQRLAFLLPQAEAA